MASYNRTQRIGEEIRKVVSTMLISGIKDYRINSMVVLRMLK
ncbi:putative ribosome-binding factor A [[Clostridium] sordellii ATCC 9714]|nr:putative ribosome-binding factor A [[Clostridium] sordellii ATCC 9714] [Paeniclostridium sordellii ATCC 9714]